MNGWTDGERATPKKEKRRIYIYNIYIRILYNKIYNNKKETEERKKNKNPSNIHSFTLITDTHQES
jgi:hypothetical protein